MKKYLPFLLLVSVLGVFHIGFKSNKVDSSNESKNSALLDLGYRGAQEYWGVRYGKLTQQEFLKQKEVARNQLSKMIPYKSLGMQFKELGPDNIGGRARALLIDNVNSNLIYAGGVSGGLFYSDNGGLTWQLTSPGDAAEVLTVVSIAQDSDGYVYYGTGEGGFYENEGDGTKGFIGKGMYKSTQPHGTTFQQLSSTWEITQQAAFNTVNAIAIDKSNHVYAGINGRLMRSKDGGQTWEIVYNLVNGSHFHDIEIGDDYYLTSYEGRVYRSTSGDLNSFNLVSGSGAGQLPITDINRTELAIAPSNNNIVYASIAKSNGSLRGIYKSSDKGQTWELIGNGGSTTFDPFNIGGGGQGRYDNCVTVAPDNENKIWVGGVTLYIWEKDKGWSKAATDFPDKDDKRYIHPDKHAIVFDPKNPKTGYMATDGGIYKTTDAENWGAVNKQFNVTQFYAVATGSDGSVIGGTQDNSNLYIDFKGNTPMAAETHHSGDGGYTAISQHVPEAFFIESQYGKFVRSLGRGTSYTDFFQHSSLSQGTSTASFGMFVTPFDLWESNNDLLIEDSVDFVADKNYNNGDVVDAQSKIPGVTFGYTLTQSLNQGDTLKVKDQKQSMFVVASRYGIYMTREALDFSKTPKWFQLTTNNSYLPISIRISPDGDDIYVGTAYSSFLSSGTLLKISNVSKVLTDADVSKVTVTTLASMTSAITDVAIDPNNKERVLFTVGGYNGGTKVYYTNNVSSVSSLNDFTPIHNNLPSMPVYSCLIEQSSGAFLLGTDLGVFSSSNQGTTWQQETNGMPNVPTVMIRQQTWGPASNYGQIYAATHGRGFFTSEKFNAVSIKEAPSYISNETLKVYPNPAEKDGVVNVEFQATNSGGVQIRIVDQTGKLVFSKSVNVVLGKNVLSVPSNGLAKGTYVITLIGTGAIASSVMMLK